MSIKSEIAKGVFWIGVSKYAGIVISLGITAILARNITPLAFGTVTVASVIMAFLDVFSELGIGPAIVQFKELSKRDLSSLFMIVGLIGFLLALCLFMLTPLISHFYDDSTLIPAIRLLCICVLFNSFNVVPNGLMLKAKRFRTIAMRTLFFQVLCGCVAVWGALHGWEIYALIITPIITSIGVFVVNYINYPLSFSFNISIIPLQKIWKFSIFQFLFSVVNYFSRNLDKLIIGKSFSMAQLGYYDKSYRLMQLPLQNISYILGPVLHPILSSLQNDKHALALKNLKLTEILSNISFPIGIMMFFTSGEIIRIIFGPNWAPAIPIFSVLALSLPLQIIHSTYGSIFLAAGKTKHLFVCGILNTCITVSAFIVAAFVVHTIVSMAWAWTISLIINFIVTYAIMYRITLHYSFRRYLVLYIPQIINTVITGIIAWWIFSIRVPHSDILALFFKLSVIGLLTVIMAFILRQYNIVILIRTAIKKLRDRRP